MIEFGFIRPLLLESHSFLAVETQKKIIGIRLLDKRPDTIPVAVVAQEEWKLKESQRGITLILFFTQLIMAVIGFFLALDFLNRKILQPAEELTISVASQSPLELNVCVPSKSCSVVPSGR